MGIDKETVPTYINVVIDDKPGYLSLLRKQAQEDGQNDEGGKKLSVIDNNHRFTMEEYYYDEKDNNLVITGNLQSLEGQTFIGICIPLSDMVLIDIMQGAIKKLNKLKTVLETLK